jgi:hypothetical protein
MKTDWLSKLLKWLHPERHPDDSHRTPSLPDPDTLKQMVQGIITTRPDEIGCDECFKQLDYFAEEVLAGKNAAEALPLVQDHLDRCDDCREEFEALLAALRALA